MHQIVRRQTSLVALSVAALVVSLIAPPFPREQALQHLPTVAGLACLLLAARRQWLSTSAFAGLIAFCWLHLLGARYIDLRVEECLRGILQLSPCLGPSPSRLPE